MPEIDILEWLPVFMGVIVLGLGYIVGNRFVRRISDGIDSTFDWLKLIFNLVLMTAWIGFIPLLLAYGWGGWRLLGLYLLAFSVGLLVGVTLMPAVWRFETRHPNIAAIISGGWVMFMGTLYLIGGWRDRNSEYLWIGITTFSSGLVTFAFGLFRLYRN